MGEGEWQAAATLTSIPVVAGLAVQRVLHRAVPRVRLHLCYTPDMSL